MKYSCILTTRVLFRRDKKMGYVMQYMYRASYRLGPKIDKVEVIRYTDKSVWLPSEIWLSKEQRVARFCGSTGYFETFIEAKSYLVNVMSQRVKTAKVNLARAEVKLQEAIAASR